MDRDYKHLNTAPRARPRSGSGSGFNPWWLALLLIPLLVAVIAWFLEGHAPRVAPDSVLARPEPAAGKAPPEPARDAFDFYRLLPQAEIAIVPPDPPDPTARAAEPPPDAPPPDARPPVAPTVGARPLPPHPAAQSPTPPAAPTPAARNPSPPTIAARTPPAAARAAQRHDVQAGAFSQQAPAEQLKARLALIGLRARIERGADALYRVRLGPYDAGELKAAHALLARHSVPATTVPAR